MKHTFYYLLVLLSVTYLTSCSTDSLEELDLKKDIPETVTGSDDPEKDPTPKDDPKEAPAEKPIDEPKKDPLASCDDFDWSNIIDSKITIDCIVNLNGKTIDIPSNTSVIYEGGDVKNGTLNFASNGKIDGELLSASLDLNGDVKLSKDEFEFIPSRWEIVEGRVNNEVARENRDLFEENMLFIKNLGAKKYLINKMDAFFNVDEPQANILPFDAAINVPGDFTLKMTNDTHLRMQPNGSKRPTLLATFRVNNVTIDGGVLHGDRDEHDYSDGGTHEWGHTLRISASKNIVVQNMTFMDATGDGVDIHAHGHTWDPHYTRSKDVFIQFNKFYRSRRNQISITDGHDIFIENNEFIDASIHTSNSRGVAPGFGIDVEAVRGTDPRGPSEVAEDIYIRNNIERGGRLGAITVHTGDKVTIENNKFENSISYSTSIGTIIRNNEITGIIEKQTEKGIAIVAGRSDRYDRNFGNRVYGNTVNGYAIGVVMNNKDLEVYGNNFINCKTGITVGSTRDCKAYDNVIKSDRRDSDGIVSHATVEYMDNVIIGADSKNNQNRIEVTRTPIKFTNVNNKPGQESYKLVIQNYTINSKNTSTINKCHGFEFVGNNITQGGIRLVDSENGTLKNNTITSTVSHGIRLDKGCKNLTISNHNVSVSDRFKCITETTTDGININVTDLNCNI